MTHIKRFFLDLCTPTSVSVTWTNTCILCSMTGCEETFHCCTVYIHCIYLAFYLCYVQSVFLFFFCGPTAAVTK